jgi:transcriptional regulator with XRE-family HTH domain
MPGGLFCSISKSCQVFSFRFKRYLFGILAASTFYFYSMKTKKPGPPKGQKHIEVKRSAFGERLYKIRKARGMTQQELGDKIGATKRVIAFYEGDHAGPTPELLQKMAAGLNVSASHLLGQKPIQDIKDTIKPSLRKYIDTLQKLSPQDQKAILRMIDLASRNGTNG